MSSAPRPPVLALLADIKEHPDDDGLRLILADWLEEHGDPDDQARAELIRCQIDHARLAPELPQKQAAGRRARWLQQRHGPAWLGPLERWLSGWVFRRGLLSISAPVGALRGQGMNLLAATETWAWVDEAYLLDAADGDVPRLRTAGLLDAVVSLGFRRSRIGPAGAQALAELPLARRLHGLDLSHCPIGDAGAQTLLSAPALAGLRALDLSACGLTAGWAPERAGVPHFPDLGSLTLWGNRLGDDGVRRLARLAGARLARLDLRANHVGEEGGLTLASSAALAGLRELNLADNALGPRAAAALAGSPHLGGIESLVLWGNPVGGEGAARLRERFGTRVHLSVG